MCMMLKICRAERVGVRPRRFHTAGSVHGVRGSGANRVKGKSPSSSRWLRRQNRDPLVKQANLEQYRSRSAYKFIELDDKFHFLQKGSIVIDCGARPGSWSQVAAKRIGTEHLSQEELESGEQGLVLAIDVEAMSQLRGVIVKDGWDITSPDVHKKIVELLNGKKADVIMSDMAPNATGVQQMDHQRIMSLCESAYSLALQVLAHKGVFLCKQWQGFLSNDFKAKLRENFDTVRECRLKATRKASAETFLYAEGYSTS